MRRLTLRDFRKGGGRIPVLNITVEDSPDETPPVSSLWGTETGPYTNRCLTVFPALTIVVVRERRLKHQDSRA